MDNKEKYVKMVELIMRSCFPEYESYTLEQQEKAHAIIQDEIIKLGTEELFARCYFMEIGFKDLIGGRA